MKIESSMVDCFARELDQRLSGLRMAHAVSYSEGVVYFHLSRGGRLVFVMNSQGPYVYIGGSSLEGSGISSTFSTILRKEVGNARIDRVYRRHEDRIICFEMTVINSVFKEEKRELVFEMISRGNLILLGNDGRILTALRTNSLSDKRPILRGVKYEEPSNDFVRPEQVDGFDFDSFESSCLEIEGPLSSDRKKQRFKKLIQHVQTRKKAAERKVQAIKTDIEKAKGHVDDGRFGDYIYMNYDSIDPQLGYMETEEGRVELDKSKGVSENAQMFYKRAKKAQTTVREGESNLEKAISDLERITQIATVIEKADDSGLEALYDRFKIGELEKQRGTKSVLGDKAILPWAVTHNGVTYLYGKSANQNDFLTFLFDTDKSHVWLHLKDNHGCHLMVRKESPSMGEIYFGAEICCLASNMEDAEVMFTPRKEVRKGNVPGQAIVGKYQTVVVRNISKEARKAFESAERVKP